MTVDVHQVSNLYELPKDITDLDSFILTHVDVSNSTVREEGFRNMLNAEHLEFVSLSGKYTKSSSTRVVQDVINVIYTELYIMSVISNTSFIIDKHL